MKKLFALLIIVGAALPVFAQMADFTEQNHQRLQLQQQGMWVLGSWAVGNMAFSGYMITRTSGTTKAFHQMNVFWNVVNLGLAGSGLYGTYQADPAAFSGLQTLREYENLNKLLLFNAGLDVGYIMTGFFLQERSRSKTQYKHQLKGYGQSLVLQGSFLFLFDLGLFALNQAQMNQWLHTSGWQLSARAPGFVSLTIPIF